MADATKETIYIDAEDEITAIIDKVRASNAKIIALVLPKRSQTLQSVVNLKLLKRTATQAKKNVALITSDQNLLPLAGAVGLHVAKTPQSKPVIPPAPGAAADANDNIETITAGDDPAVKTAAKAGVVAEEGEETIDLDNEKPKADGKKLPAALAGKKLFNKKLKVPDFDRFRLLLFGGIGLLIVIIVGSIFAFAVLPKATISVKTDTSSVTTDLILTAQTSAKELDKEKLIIQAVKKELKKTENEKATATGQKNTGEKATGTVKIYNCNKDDKLSDTVRAVPAGAIVSAGGSSFILTEAVDVEPSSFTGNTCMRNKPSDSASVVAQVSGDQYNLGARKYSVTGFPSMDADGGDMSGGTTKLVQVISQQDINTAKDKLLERLDAAAKTDLKGQFEADNMQLLEDTYGAGTPAVTSTPNANEEGAEATVTVTITYAQLGVKKDDLKQLIESNVEGNIDTSKQVIRDNGLGSATIRVLEKKSADEAKFSISTISIAGPQLDAEAIKKDIAGKKKGATVQAIQSRPGIKDVEINYSPFWVFSTPKRLNRINITFDQNNAQ